MERDSPEKYITALVFAETNRIEYYGIAIVLCVHLSILAMAGQMCPYRNYIAFEFCTFESYWPHAFMVSMRIRTLIAYF